MFHFLSTKIYLVWVGSFAAIISYSLYWNIHGNYPACNHCDIKIVLYIILADNNGVKIQLVRFRGNFQKKNISPIVKSSHQFLSNFAHEIQVFYGSSDFYWIIWQDAKKSKQYMFGKFGSFSKRWLDLSQPNQKSSE